MVGLQTLERLKRLAAWFSDTDRYIAVCQSAAQPLNLDQRPADGSPYEHSLEEAQRNADRDVHNECDGNCAAWRDLP